MQKVKESDNKDKQRKRMFGRGNKNPKVTVLKSQRLPRLIKKNRQSLRNTKVSPIYKGISYHSLFFEDEIKSPPNFSHSSSWETWAQRPQVTHTQCGLSTDLSSDLAWHFLQNYSFESEAMAPLKRGEYGDVGISGFSPSPVNLTHLPSWRPYAVWNTGER